MNVDRPDAELDADHDAGPIPMKRLARVASVVLALAIAAAAQVRAPSGARASLTPIEHVVVIYQENHSFDNVLGLFCIQNARCDGASTGQISDGSTISLAPATDVVPYVAHNSWAQKTAIHGGLMDGFDRIQGCESATGYACYSQFDPTQIPSVAALASQFAVSDRTFELSAIPSWGGHVELVAATLDGFLGNNPTPAPDHYPASGWGCDSYKETKWDGPEGRISVPACIPAPDGSGPYKPSPVPWVPTIMDRMDEAGLTWKIYRSLQGTGNHNSYNWATCPSFADCVFTSQVNNQAFSSQVIDDATAGTLPALSLVMPRNSNSQHNGYSTLEGDNWIASVVNAIESGPEWSSTAIFITWDDCGCFYDHVPPPTGLGIRVPMVMVSPYAKPAFTDSTDASFASMLAFTEHTFGLAPLADADANAYDFSNAFDYSQHPLAPVHLPLVRVPRATLRYISAHPPGEDGT